MSFVLKKVEEIRKELEDIKRLGLPVRDHIDNIEKILNEIEDRVKKRIEVEEEIFYMKYNEF